MTAPPMAAIESLAGCTCARNRPGRREGLGGGGERAVDDQREAAVEAEVLDIQSYVMVGVRGKAAVKLGHELVVIAAVTTFLPPLPPRREPCAHHGRVLYADHTALSQT